MGMIGEEYRPKIDPLSEILASMSADLNNEKKKKWLSALLHYGNKCK